MEFASEFLIEAVQQGVSIEQVPIVYRRRLGGQPKLRTFRDGLRHLRLMLARSTSRERAIQSVRPDWRPAAALVTGGETIVDLTLLGGHDIPSRDVVALSVEGATHTAERLDHV
jgi:hypothetical protein